MNLSDSVRDVQVLDPNAIPTGGSQSSSGSRRTPSRATAIVGSLLLVGAVAAGTAIAQGLSGSATEPSTSSSTPQGSSAGGDTSAADESPTDGRPAKSEHASLTAASFQEIAENPEAHVGERVVVYVAVTQFVGGMDEFRAFLGVAAADLTVQDGMWSGTGSYFSGLAEDLEAVAEGDLVKVWAVVGGTQDVGDQALPHFGVNHVQVVGSADLS